MELKTIGIAFLITISIGLFAFQINHMEPQITAVETKNVLGTKLQSCCLDPVTGFFRDGFCQTNAQDYGTHVVCARMTREFLDYTLAQGNDLCTARPEYRFPGLKPGDKWCLCAVRWKEAIQAGVAPPVILESTHEKALEYVTLEQLKAHEEINK